MAINENRWVCDVDESVICELHKEIVIEYLLDQTFITEFNIPYALALDPSLVGKTGLVPYLLQSAFGLQNALVYSK